MVGPAGVVCGVCEERRSASYGEAVLAHVLLVVGRHASGNLGQVQLVDRDAPQDGTRQGGPGAALAVVVDAGQHRQLARRLVAELVGVGREGEARQQQVGRAGAGSADDGLQLQGEALALLDAQVVDRHLEVEARRGGADVGHRLLEAEAERVRVGGLVIARRGVGQVLGPQGHDEEVGRVVEPAGRRSRHTQAILPREREREERLER